MGVLLIQCNAGRNFSVVSGEKEKSVACSAAEASLLLASVLVAFHSIHPSRVISSESEWLSVRSRSCFY